jgi:hypothetical protein
MTSMLGTSGEVIGKMQMAADDTTRTCLLVFYAVTSMVRFDTSAFGEGL